MLEGRLDQTWAKWTRPWTIFAWLFQTIGIALGSWWVLLRTRLGRVVCSGYPVENASFMPWLVGTALIHSLSVTEKRGYLQELDSCLLAIFAFSLSLVGTFLVRSACCARVGAFICQRSDPRSVHPRIPGAHHRRFADPVRLARAETLRTGGFELLSREFFLLVNNVILVGVAGLVLWGTLSPLVYEVLGLGKIIRGASGIRW